VVKLGLKIAVYLSKKTTKKHYKKAWFTRVAV